MMAMTVKEILQAVNGTLLQGEENALVTGVFTDSRHPEAGGLFLPWKGERFDGHNFIGAALSGGAAGCLTAETPETLLPGKFYIRVPDTRLALKDLAAAWRSRFSIPVIQITGSVGKTTMKELLASVLSEKYHVLKTEGNFNNDIGTPLTLLRLDASHEAAVIETGMNHAGEIRYLGEMVRPDIAVITNVSDVHFEFFGSREGIFRAKCEIFENLKPEGFAVLNGDDALLRTVSLPQSILLCGEGENCAVRVSDYVDHGIEGVACTVTTAKERYELKIPAPGRHMLCPAAIAVAVGERLGLSREEIVRGVAAYAPTGERMRIERLAEGRVMLNDSYNASPVAMAAALRILAQRPGKRIAVLGPLGELGGLTEQSHRDMGRLVGELGIDTFFAITPMSVQWMAPEALRAGCRDVRCYEKKEDAYAALAEAFTPGSTLLLKASHYAGRFDLIADYLRAYGF
ncbi:MAG: UDP-N-acetylmuramoyl-tripeptide--D-alanyl-D-alanine ligase [Oscillospiraceae bacterium]